MNDKIFDWKLSWFGDNKSYRGNKTRTASAEPELLKHIKICMKQDVSDPINIVFNPKNHIIASLWNWYYDYTIT